MISDLCEAIHATPAKSSSSWPGRSPCSATPHDADGERWRLHEAELLRSREEMLSDIVSDLERAGAIVPRAEDQKSLGAAKKLVRNVLRSTRRELHDAEEKHELSVPIGGRCHPRAFLWQCGYSPREVFVGSRSKTVTFENGMALMKVDRRDVILPNRDTMLHALRIMLMRRD